MPFFIYPITVPKATYEWSPVTELLPVIHGIIHHLSIWFSPGCQGEVGVRLFRRESQILPWNADAWALGDNNTAGGSPEWIELESAPYEIRYKAYNIGEYVDRDVIVQIGILPREVLMPEKKLTDYLVAFLQRLRVPLPWVKS